MVLLQGGAVSHAIVAIQSGNSGSWTMRREIAECWICPAGDSIKMWFDIACLIRRVSKG